MIAIYLIGKGRKTEMWVTNIGNEHGQVLMSVFTVGEGSGLKQMLDGLVTRYINAGVPPPKAPYVDRDCCGASSVHKYLRPGPFFISGVYDFSCSYMYNIDGFRYITMSLTFYCQCFLGWTYGTSCAAFPMAAPLISINCTVCSWGS